MYDKENYFSIKKLESYKYNEIKEIIKNVLSGNFKVLSSNTDKSYSDISKCIDKLSYESGWSDIHTRWSSFFTLDRGICLVQFKITPIFNEVDNTPLSYDVSPFFIEDGIKILDDCPYDVRNSLTYEL